MTGLKKTSTSSSRPVISPETNTSPVASSDGDISAFVDAVRKSPRRGQGRGRLIFAMDATMSRQPTWDSAMAIQSQMFAETAAIGGLSVQLMFFRGFGECQSSKWVNDAKGLSRLMSKVSCRGGHTQIGRILSHAVKEAGRRPVSAVVFVGDAMEEDIDSLAQSAGELGLMKVPVFMFHEGQDRAAEIAFQEIARLSGGAYCRFSASAADELRRLLAAVAVYAAGGQKALASRGQDRAAQALLKQLP